MIQLQGDSADAEQDPLYDQAVQVVMDTRKASISGVQRRLKIGYNRAARMGRIHGGGRSGRAAAIQRNAGNTRADG